jgi:hypothetical protein
MNFHESSEGQERRTGHVNGRVIVEGGNIK